MNEWVKRTVDTGARDRTELDRTTCLPVVQMATARRDMKILFLVQSLM